MKITLQLHLPSPRPQLPTCRKTGAERASAAYGPAGNREKTPRGSVSSVLYPRSCGERELGSVQHNTPPWCLC